jgi:lipopolysaccharide/colanic/teichoic acid biosynthesis glycosyltransferase
VSTKRLFDVAVSGLALLVTAPLLGLVALLIWLQDFHNPLYIAPRVGQGERPFRMIKFRSMVVNADRTGVTSTSAGDRRVTPIGRFVRRFKLDELVQLWNVFRGDMSLVGPRPNVPSGVAVYTRVEKGLLDVRPGITDFASIVFSDEGEVLQGHPDADLAYDQLIRPWKSRLGLFYVSHSTVWCDIQLVWLTAVAIVSRPTALRRVSELLARLGAPEDLVRIAMRAQALEPGFPPGATTS